MPKLKIFSEVRSVAERAFEKQILYCHAVYVRMETRNAWKFLAGFNSLINAENFLATVKRQIVRGDYSALNFGG